MYRKNLKKIDIIKNLSDNTGFSLNFSKKLIDDLIKILSINIKTDNLKLKNIGTFKLLNKKERIGRNPKTKKEFIISARKELDKLDNNLLDIIKKRTKLVDKVIQNKRFKKDIVDKKRISIILRNISIKSRNKKIDPKITNKIWKSMIKAFIAYEYRNFKKKR